MILTLFGSRAFSGIKKQSRALALASMVLKKTTVREQVATGTFFRFQMSIFSFRAELATGGEGGGANKKFYFVVRRR